MKIKSLVAGWLLLPGLALAQYNYGFDFAKTGSGGLQFLKIGVGARESAMGEAVTGAVKDVSAVFWNPAGLAYATRYQAAFSHNAWLVNSKQMAAAVAIPFKTFSIAVSALSFTIEDFEETTVTHPEGTGRMVSAGDAMIGLAAARMFTDKLSIGGQLKYVNEKLDEYSLDNVLFDVGALYYTGFRHLRLAFALQHFGPDMKIVDQTFRTPLLFRLNATDELFQNAEMALTAGVELVHATDNVEVVNLGTELQLRNLLYLRGGYRFNTDEGKLACGFGLVTPAMAGVTLKIDYAFVQSELVFADVHRFSVGLAF
ncbi:MAG TPA: PorV/PorQ family protein [bacterium]|nr:PorV/PorQ family protein [bacterium]HQG44540.1 PorV/PorQ family protein [bacterium]HQI48461.1 PorV/PorQ family protein [bacterium]HQJ66354.1 PorV/PorQ family protein [bacterium]